MARLLKPTDAQIARWVCAYVSDHKVERYGDFYVNNERIGQLSVSLSRRDVPEGGYERASRYAMFIKCKGVLYSFYDRVL